MVLCTKRKNDSAFLKQKPSLTCNSKLSQYGFIFPQVLAYSVTLLLLDCLDLLHKHQSSYKACVCRLLV